jgi:hypothetical protein
MFSRSLWVFGIVLASAAVANAASVTRFSVRCVDRQEVSADDVFLAATHDGKPVAWAKEHQQGTSRDNSINMNDGDVLSLDAKSLGLMKFDQAFQVTIHEKDVAADEVIGTVNITPSDGAKKAVFKTADFEYHVEYTVE